MWRLRCTVCSRQKTLLMSSEGMRSTFPFRSRICSTIVLAFDFASVLKTAIETRDSGFSHSCCIHSRAPDIRKLDKH